MKNSKKITEEEKKALFWKEFRRELGERLRPKAKKVVEALVENAKYLSEEKHK